VDDNNKTHPPLKPHPQGVNSAMPHGVAQVNAALCQKWREDFSPSSARRKGVDERNLNVVAQVNVTMMNKSKASFRMPTVRNSKRSGASKFNSFQ
jgi:hypothetical protein